MTTLFRSRRAPRSSPRAWTGDGHARGRGRRRHRAARRRRRSCCGPAAPADPPRPRATRLRRRAARAADGRGGDRPHPAARQRWPSPVRTRGKRERRLVAVASAAVLLGGTAGMATAAQNALPGEALYPIKRGIEKAEAGLSRRARPARAATCCTRPPAGSARPRAWSTATPPPRRPRSRTRSRRSPPRPPRLRPADGVLRGQRRPRDDRRPCASSPPAASPASRR